MQFKSIIAVLALAVAVSATPVDPVAVKLVPRTPTTPAPAPVVQQCKAGQVFISNCTANGVPIATASNAGGLLNVLQGLLLLPIAANIECLFNQVPLVNIGGICCNVNQGPSTTTQTGLVNLGDIRLFTCS